MARTKGEIYQGLAVDGMAIVNEDDDYAHFWDELLIDQKSSAFFLNKTRGCLCARHFV